MGATTPQAVSTADSSSISNEELIEAIIDEKWNELVKDINKIIDWKTSAEGRISSMEQEVKDLKDSFDKLHQAVVGKVGEYDQHILDVGSELKAMEKVFAKILPVFTENVSALTRITDDLKGLKK
jgi:predicted site-specific integrase-resolvase